MLEDMRIPRQVAFLANLSRDEDRNKSLVGLRGWPRRVARQLNSASRQKQKEL